MNGIFIFIYCKPNEVETLQSLIDWFIAHLIYLQQAQIKQQSKWSVVIIIMCEKILIRTVFYSFETDKTIWGYI